MSRSTERAQPGLANLRVVDFTFGIAGAYCTKLLGDAGADVVKVEPPEGDPWRSWSIADAPIDPIAGSALFRYLHHGARSVIGTPDAPEILELIAGADVVVEGFPAAVFDRLRLHDRDPGLVLLSITPFGRTGPFAERPSTEFTVQAESGGLASRGAARWPPYQAGGRISEWLAGTLGAMTVTATARRARLTGYGEHIDLSICESMSLAAGAYAAERQAIAGHPPITAPSRSLETPSIEPTLDGWVGFCTNSRQQFDDFLILIERPDLLGDEELAARVGRQVRWQEWNDTVHAWTTRHATTEILRRASALRIPVAPVGRGDTVMDFPQFVERGVFVDDPTRTFVMPRRSWRIDDVEAALPRPSPRLGEHTGRVEPHVRARPQAATGDRRLPLEGIRVLDLTAWWAGPMGAGMLAMLGADVIHVESITRIDGMRTVGTTLGLEGPWWEHSPTFIAPNTNKRGITLDLQRPEGMALLKQLIQHSDVVMENFTPRVLTNFGLDYDAIRELNPACILLRMPAFGLSGPWRDNSGFAQTMEQLSGLASITGHRFDQPRIHGGPSDPTAGMHAVFALLVALTERDTTGVGSVVESTMVESVLNVAAEVVIEQTAYGNTLERDGNRSPRVAPQGLYACEGIDRWLAVSVATDEQWAGLVRALGRPEWATDRALQTYAGRRAAHDRIDEHLTAWCDGRDADERAQLLVDEGVPASAVRDARLLADHPQYLARRYHEKVNHPEVGDFPSSTVPFRFASVDRWIRRTAPTLGEHNHEILVGELGMSEEAFAALEADGVIGTRPAGL